LGVKGYICKTIEPNKMKKALLGMSMGETCFPPQIDLDNSVYDNFAHLGLTNRQCDIMQVLEECHSNKAIAWKLNIAESTVKRHLYNIYNTLNVSNRAEALKLMRSQPSCNGY
ncbi:MAG: response regulator transcription factor, partial [Mariprofundaceae bacterium]|nr:response regulator transcription factor [Mariprofundaceae bacterium]